MLGIIGVPEEDKKKGCEKILEEIIVENFSKMGKEIATQIQETQSPKKDKPKDKDPKTHSNQTNEDQTRRANIKSSKGKGTNNIPIRITAHLSIETLQARRNGRTLLK